MPLPSIPRVLTPSHKEMAEISQLAMESGAAQALAAKVAEEAKRIAIESGHPDLADAVTVTSARPRGRGQIQVVIDHPDATATEFGDTGTEAARILGKAAGVQLWPDVTGEP